MNEVKRRLKEEKNAKDEDVLVSLQLVNEMLVRGYEFSCPSSWARAGARSMWWRTARCACPSDLALRVLSTAAIMSIVTSIAAPAFAGTYYIGKGSIDVEAITKDGKQYVESETGG